LSRTERLEKSRRWAFENAHFDPRTLAPQSGQCPREPLATEGVSGPYTQLRGTGRGKTRRAIDVGEALKGGLGGRQEANSLGSERHTAGVPPEELRLPRGLERREARREAGLGPPEPLRGAQHAAVPGDRDERLESRRVRHGPMISSWSIPCSRAFS